MSIPDRIYKQVARELKQTDGFGRHIDRDVRLPVSAAWCYGDAFLRPSVDIAYVLAVAVLKRNRYSIPCCTISRRDDPESIDALADRWRRAYAGGDR